MFHEKNLDPQGAAPCGSTDAELAHKSRVEEDEESRDHSLASVDVQKRIAAVLAGGDHGDFSMSPPSNVTLTIPQEEKKLRTKWRYAIISGALALLVIIVVAVLTSGNKIPPPLSQEDIEIVLRDASETGGIEFDIPSSYQYKAMLWNMNNPVNSRRRLLQRYGLVCVFYATFQTSNKWLQTNHAGQELFPWHKSRGWLTYDNECDWTGVDCDSKGNVIELDLGKNDLSGTFPREIAHLAPSLISLDIESNYFYNHGEEELAFLGRLTNLKHLYMRDSLLQNDGLPRSIGKLTQLEELDCSHSMFHGPLDKNIFRDLRQLKYLEISGNSINGPIPATLTYLPRLKYFYASDCDIQAQNLDFMMAMPSIIEVWLDRNPGLTGTIPSEIGTIKTLESLSVTSSGLSGSIPTSVGKMTNMQQMWLYDNQLTGTIPSDLGRMTDLETLSIEANALVGEMPNEICEHRPPSGVLEKVTADCDDTITCSCCDCCGASCFNGTSILLRKKFLL